VGLGAAERTDVVLLDVGGGWKGQLDQLENNGRFTMLLPPELAWLELVIIGTVAVFGADLIGNPLEVVGSCGDNAESLAAVE
jgi:hypothetical protein